MRRDDPLFHSTHPRAPASTHDSASDEIVLVHPPELYGQRIPLAVDTVLGRSPDPEVTPILHVTISRRHAALRPGLGGILCLADLDSRNGTRVNGQRSELPQPLTRQVVVRVGDVLGVVEQRTEAVFEPAEVLPGASPQMAEARRTLALAARDPAPVLVLGETGAGKEAIARELHARSGRTGAYVALSCAEISPQLVESELFGHEKGAFTGAHAAKTGLFLAAEGGTLFLDEIGELPLELQSKLLRALQEREVRPVGATRSRPVDVRIVAATNRDLPALVEKERFRRDLYARLAFWELELPPLRERRQDILPWLGLFLARWNDTRDARAELAFTPDAAEQLLLYRWADNLRGLERLVHRLASAEATGPVGLRALTSALPDLVLAGEPTADTAGPTPVGEQTRSTSPPARGSGAPGAVRREAPTREQFLAVYEASGRSVRATSKHFGKERRQIYRWLESFGIAREPNED